MQAIITLTPEEATERLRALGMHISPQNIRDGIQQKTYPFGDCVLNGKSRRFQIYDALLTRWIAERVSEVEN